LFTESTGFFQGKIFFGVRLGSDGFGARGGTFFGIEGLDALADFAAKSFENSGRDLAKGSAKQFLFESIVFSAERSEFLHCRLGDLLVRGGVDCFDARFDFGVGLPVPFNESRFGYTQLPSDSGKTHALAA
jgi:hypothetical protein